MLHGAEMGEERLHRSARETDYRALFQDFCRHIAIDEQNPAHGASGGELPLENAKFIVVADISDATALKSRYVELQF